MISMIKRMLILLLGTVVFFNPSQAMGKEWSDVQNKVWQMEQDYWESIRSGDIEGYLDLIHDSVIAWPANRRYPMDKTQTKFLVQQMINSKAFTSVELVPEEVLVIDDTAVVYYTYKLKAGISAGSRIIHTWKKQEGQWKMIGGMSSSGLN